MRECFMEQVQDRPARALHRHAGVQRPRLQRAPRRSCACPTLVITGRDDHFAPPDKAEDVQRCIPGAQLAVIDDAGHMLTSEQPAAFNRAVDAFLQAAAAMSALDARRHRRRLRASDALGAGQDAVPDLRRERARRARRTPA